MNIDRHIVETIKDYAKDFPVVLLTGLRQTGKSYIFTEFFKSIRYETLDDIHILDIIENDPVGALDSMPIPLVLDEIQRNKDIFLSLKLKIDKKRKNGMYYLTGSQKYELMENVSESLAGRIGIINLMGLSNREIDGVKEREVFLPIDSYYKKQIDRKKISAKTLWDRIYRGSFPEVYVNKDISVEHFYSSLVSSYIERDVRNLSQVGDLKAFLDTMTALASRIGQLLDMTDISRDLHIDIRTVKNYISILEASNVIYFLRPFSPNINNRLIKTPKIYFTDTGIVAYLCKYKNSEILKNGAINGHIFENYIINEILKSYYNKGKEPNVYFYRDKEKQEIDLLLYENDTLYPIEIKHTSTPKTSDIVSFDKLKSVYSNIKVGDGALICNYDKLSYLNEKNKIVPFWYI